MMNRDSFYLSTIYDVVGDDTGAGLRYLYRTEPIALANGMGLELAEYCISDNLDDDTDVREHFLYNAAAVRNKVLHAPYNELYPHAIDKKVAQVAYDRYDRAYGIANAVGCTKMIVHAGFVPQLYYPIWFKERQVDFWKAFLEKHPGPMEICLENVLEQIPDLVTDIIYHVGSERLRMCLDVGHANLTDLPPMEWLKRAGSYISHLHIHNNAGRGGGAAASGDTHCALNRGTIPMKELLNFVRDSIPNATITLETAELEESVNWLKSEGYV